MLGISLGDTLLRRRVPKQQKSNYDEQECFHDPSWSVVTPDERLGGGFMARPLERWQPIAEMEPPQIVAQPRMMRRRKQIGVVEGTRRDIDEAGPIGMLIGEGCSTACAKGAAHGRRGMKLGRPPLNQVKLCARERDPGNYRCTGEAAAGLTMADHAAGRLARDAIANCTAEAAAIYSGRWHCDSLRS